MKPRLGVCKDKDLREKHFSGSIWQWIPEKKGDVLPAKIRVKNQIHQIWLLLGRIVSAISGQFSYPLKDRIDGLSAG